MTECVWTNAILRRQHEQMIRSQDGSPRKWTIVGWLAAIAVALLIVTTNVRITANSLWLYEQLFDRNQVPLRAGMDMPSLLDVGQQIQDYFSSETEPLQVLATLNGVEVELFGGDEVSHMSDVKQLFKKTYRLQILSAAFLIIAGVLAYGTLGRTVMNHFALWVKRGALLASVVIMVIGAASVVAFEQVFLLFHYIGFPQGNFTFDTGRDYLVRVFPSGFWEDITFVIGGLTMLESLLLYGIVFALGQYTAKRRTSRVSSKERVT